MTSGKRATIYERILAHTLYGSDISLWHWQGLLRFQQGLHFQYGSVWQLLVELCQHLHSPCTMHSFSTDLWDPATHAVICSWTPRQNTYTHSAACSLSTEQSKSGTKGILNDNRVT